MNNLNLDIKVILIITLIVIIVIVGYYCFVYLYQMIKNECTTTESMVNIKKIDKSVTWTTDKDCPYQMVKALLDTFAEYNISKTTPDDNWIIYVPCTYNNLSSEMKKINPSSPDQRIYIVNNADEISGKDNLWSHLVRKYGREGAKLLSPNTYLLNDSHDMKLFNEEYDSNKLYILKKNIQRQEGLKITNDKDTIIKARNDNYVLVQELLQNPFLINGRKINMRFYLLLVCQNNEISAYVHQKGFMYYTKMPFVKNSLKDGNNITTGYIERWIYKINPLTHADFRKYLNDPELSNRIFNNIYEVLKKVVIAVSHKICIDSHLKPYITFQLFGADIALNDDLKPLIMEVNKGCNLAFFDERDTEVKMSVVRDILKVIKVVDDVDNGYIKIADLGS